MKRIKIEIAEVFFFICMGGALSCIIVGLNVSHTPTKYYNVGDSCVVVDGEGSKLNCVVVEKNFSELKVRNGEKVFNAWQVSDVVRASNTYFSKGYFDNE